MIQSRTVPAIIFLTVLAIVPCLINALLPPFRPLILSGKPPIGINTRSGHSFSHTQHFLSSSPDDELGVAVSEEEAAQKEKARRNAELKAQEVFIKRETGRHICGNCGYTYDETKGDTDKIGGTNPPGTLFASLPSNYRCPVCRGSKDQFTAVVDEIPGFEVNQGYGFGTNGLTADQKNLLIFGGLAFFFVLFISGYALN